MGEIVVGIDIGTTKICTLVGEVRANDTYILGVGIEPARGMRKGMVTDVDALSASISSAVHKAERSSGYEIGRAFVSLSATNARSLNSSGVTGIAGNREVDDTDLQRVMESARAIQVPHGHEILHTIPRRYNLDDYIGVRNPQGMHGYRLEVDAHIIMSSSTSLRNFEKCVEKAGVYVDRFILNPLASGDIVLTNTERESGVMALDIGGGTTDIAVFIDGSIWHTGSVPVGGQHVTNDIAQVLSLPYEIAESVKLDFGHADPREVNAAETFPVQPFGEERLSKVKRLDLANIINARVTELFELVQAEMEKSGYQGLLPAGVVLTGGASLLPGMRAITSQVLRVPARLAQPENISGMTDMLRSPSFSTVVGLLRLGLIMDIEDRRQHDVEKTRPANNTQQGGLGKLLGGFFKRFLPEDEQFS
jgi:cell division protein FtsA